MWKLNQTKQCKTCPWRVDSKVKNIPNYCSQQHQDLEQTITDDRDIIQQVFDSQLKIMACHHSDDNNSIYCVGWLYNQLGTGNNIRLRIKFMSCANINELEVIGKQVKSFKDTFKCN